MKCKVLLFIPALLSDMELDLKKSKEQLASAKVCTCISIRFSV